MSAPSEAPPDKPVRAGGGILHHLGRSHRITIVLAAGLTALAAVMIWVNAPSVARFSVSGLDLAALAALVGQAIDQVGERLGPGPTGLLQSTLGNLPELFVGIFALADGLTEVVRAALVGSVLGNAVLVLGMAFVAGGLRHGTQRFGAEAARLNASLLLLVVAALLVPTLASHLGTPAAAHAGTLSDDCAVILLIVYALSIPYHLRQRGADTAGSGEPAFDGRAGAAGGAAGRETASAGEETASAGNSAGNPAANPAGQERVWPLRLSVALLALASAGSALAADWFVGPLEDATRTLGLSQTFTGLVVVAIASNAVEHAVGVRFALKAKPEYAISTILNSPLQVALLLTPMLVLLSTVVGPTQLTLVFPTLLVAALAISAIVVTVVIYDGEYTWIEGVALLGLYCMLAASFWWG